MLTIKLYENSQQGLQCAVIREAESVEVTRSEDCYIIDLYKNGSVDGRLILNDNKASTLYVENSLGKTVQRIDSAIFPKVE